MNIRRTATTSAVVATAVAATIGVGMGASAAPATAKSDVPRPAAASAVQSAGELTQGGLYRFVSQRYEALDVDGSQASDGTKVQTWQSNGSPAQTWRFWDAGDGSHLVETTVPGGADKVLDADVNKGTASLWQLNGANGEANQRWSFESAGGGWFKVRNVAKGCLTAGAATGDPVSVTDCGDDLSQLWCLESAEPRSGPTAEKGIRGETA
ncbi:hypothetical protein DT019_34385, partial [Streptomyces sp. SDr-06]